MNCGYQIVNNYKQQISNQQSYDYQQYNTYYPQQNYQQYNNYQQDINNQTYTCSSQNINYQQKAVQDDCNSTLKKEVFNFGVLSGNETNVKKINNWLNDRRISIKRISITTSARVIFACETVVNRVEIEYYENVNGYIYHFDYLITYKLFGDNFIKVDKKMEDWKNKNTDKKIVWSQHSGHQTMQHGSSQVIYFIYR